MREKLNYIFSLLIVFIIIFGPTKTLSDKAMSANIDTDTSGFIKKVSKSYTNKFCNSIAFGLSKESAMNFSIEENQKDLKKERR